MLPVLHRKVELPVAVTDSCEESPRHILGGAADAVIKGVTVIFAVSVLTHPFASVPVTT